MSQTGTAVVAANKGTLRDLMEKGKGELVKALPPNFGVDRFIRTCITLFQTQPGLSECSPMSVLVSAMRAAELGLELSSPLGQAYLVPFFNGKAGCKEAQLQVGYRGLIGLAYRSKLVMKINARVVHEKDTFSYRYGSDEFVQHQPYEGDDDPGPITHFYAMLWTTAGGRDFEVMTLKQVERHRDRFSKQPRGFGWKDHFEPMGLKTVLRKLCKRAPMLTELSGASAEDEYAEAGIIPNRENPFTGEILEGCLLGPNDDGVGDPEGEPAPAQPARKSRTEQLSDKVGAGREAGVP